MTPIKENLAFLIRGGRGTLDYGIIEMHRPPGKDVVHTYVRCKREGRKVVPCEKSLQGNVHRDVRLPLCGRHGMTTYISSHVCVARSRLEIFTTPSPFIG